MSTTRCSECGREVEALDGGIAQGAPVDIPTPHDAPCGLPCDGGRATASGELHTRKDCPECGTGPSRAARLAVDIADDLRERRAQGSLAILPDVTARSIVDDHRTTAALPEGLRRLVAKELERRWRW